MNNRDCLPCSTEVNQYEDDWICTLIEWLDKVTCVGWIRAYPDSARPDQSDTKTGQYGTVHVDSIRYVIPQKSENATSSDNEVCLRVKHRVEASVELRVYNYAQMPAENGQRLRTSGDVLLRVLDAYYGIPRLSGALKAERISIEEHGQINNFEEQLQSSYQRRSSLNITLCINRATSFADDLIAGFTLDVGRPESDCE